MGSGWIEFFKDAGLDQDYVPRYAVIFEENRIRPDMLTDLNHEYLTDMGIIAMGDKIAILKHAKNVSEALKHERVTARDPDPVPDSPECLEPESVDAIIAGPSTPSKVVLPQLPVPALIDMELAHTAPKKKLELLSPLRPVPVIQEELDQSDCLELEPFIHDFDIDIDRPSAPSKSPKVLFVDKPVQQVARNKDILVTIRSRSNSPSNRKSSNSNGNNVWKGDVGAKSHQRIQNQNGVVSRLPRDDLGRDVSADRDQEEMPRVKSKVQVVQPQQPSRNQSAQRQEPSSSADHPDRHISRHPDHIRHRLTLLANQEVVDLVGQDDGSDYDYKERTARRHKVEEYHTRRSGSGHAHDTTSTSRRSSGYSGSSIARDSDYRDRDRDRRSRSGETSSRSASRSRHQEDLPRHLTNSFGHLDSAQSYVNRNNKYSDWGTSVSLLGSSSRSESGHNRHREYDDEYSHRGSRGRSRHSGDRDRDEAESGQRHATKRRSESSREPEYVPRDHDRGRDRSRKSRSRTKSPSPPPPGSGSKAYETLDSRYQCKSAKISRNYDGPSKLHPTFFH